MEKNYNKNFDNNNNNNLIKNYNDKNLFFNEKLKKIQNEIKEKNNLIDEIDLKYSNLSNFLYNNNNNKNNNKNNENSILLNNLKKSENEIKKNIKKLILIENKFNIESNSCLNLIDKNNIKFKLENIKSEKNILTEKLNNINYKITEIIEKEKFNKNKNLFIKNFNFDNKKNYRKNILNLNNNNNNNNNNIKNKIKNLNSIENKKFLTEKNLKNFNEKEFLFKQKENDYYKKTLTERKNHFKSFSLNELNDFTKKVNENKKFVETQLKIKSLKLKEIFNERKKLLPKFKSSFNVNLNLIEKEKKENENKKKDFINNKNNIIKNYDKNLKKNFKINEKLKFEREKNFSLDFNNKQNLIKNIKNFQNSLKNNNKYFNYKVPKIIISNEKKIYLKNLINKNKKNSIKNKEKIDYLKEIINKKNNKKNNNNFNIDNNNSHFNFEMKKFLFKNKLNEDFDDIKFINNEIQNSKIKLNNTDNNNYEEKFKLIDDLNCLYVSNINQKLEVINKINKLN